MNISRNQILIASALTIAVGVNVSGKLSKGAAAPSKIINPTPVELIKNETSSSVENILGINEDVGKEKIKGVGVSNVSGKIKTLSSIVSDKTVYIIIDLLKEKIGDYDFRYNLFYINDNDLDFLYKLLNQSGINPDSSQINFIKIRNGEGITPRFPWVRDGSIIMKDFYGDSYILESKLSRAKETTGKNGFDFLLSQEEGIRYTKSDLIFQGGNIRQTDDYLFIGVDDIIANINYKRGKRINLSQAIKYSGEYSSEDVEEVLIKFEKTFGKKIIPIGVKYDGWNYEINGNQPIEMAHIDTFLTPIGEGIIILKKPIKNKKDANWIKEIKGYLEKEGFSIVDLDEVDSRQDVFVNYNNVLIEDSGTQKIVYVPQYSYNKGYINLRDSDNYALNKFTELGFKAIPVRIDISNIKHRGSLNCLTFEIRETY